MKVRRLLLSIVMFMAAMLVAVPSSAQRSPISDQEIGDRLTNFYRNPELATIPGLIGAVGQSPAMMRPDRVGIIAGFFGGLFAKHPKHIDQFLANEPTPPMKRFLLIALSLAGNSQKYVEYGKRWGIDTSNGIKGWAFSDLKVRGPNDFDMLWSASFASGDPRYVRQIWSFYAAYANRPETDLGDLDLAARFREPGNQGAMKALADKYGRERFVELVIAGTALWSMRSNAQQHAFVRNEIVALIGRQKNSNAAKAFAIPGRG